MAVSCINSKVAAPKLVDGTSCSRAIMAFVGLEADVKPTTSYKDVFIANGSKFIDMTNSVTYMYDEENAQWLEQGGSGTESDTYATQEFVIAALLSTPLTRHVIDDADVTLTAEWGHKYIFGSNLTSLDVTLATPPTDHASEIIIVIDPVTLHHDETTDTDVLPTLTFPADVTIDGNDLAEGERWELSIDEDLLGYARSV